MMTSLRLAGWRAHNRPMISSQETRIRIPMAFRHCSRPFARRRQAKQVRNGIQFFGTLQLRYWLDTGSDDLRAQIKTLLYEIESFKQEREFTNLRHEKELRDAQTKADADFKRAQVVWKSSRILSHNLISQS